MRHRAPPMSPIACFANPYSARRMAWRLQSAQMSVVDWLFTAAIPLTSSGMQALPRRP